MFKLRGLVLASVLITYKSNIIENKCQEKYFNFFNRKICEQCLTGMIQNTIQYGSNIDHYENWETLDWEGVIPEFSKLIIYGQDEWTFACIANLRKLKYFGEIYLVTSQNTLPYRKNELISQISQPNPNMIIKNQQFYDNYRVKVKKNIEIQQLSFQPNQIKFQGEYRKIPFDKIFISPRYTTKFPFGIRYAKSKVFKLDNLQDFYELRNQIKKVKSIHIVGGTAESIQLYDRLKTTYPQINMSYSYEKTKQYLKEFIPQGAIENARLIEMKDSNELTLLREQKYFDELSKTQVIKNKEYIQKQSQLIIMMDHKESNVNSFYIGCCLDKQGRVNTNLYNQEKKNSNIYFAKAASKKTYYNVNEEINSLDNVHNCVFNLLNIKSDFNYPNLNVFTFQNKKTYFLGACQEADWKFKIKDVTYFLKNNLLIGAISEDPIKIAMIREGLAYDVLPLIKQQIDVFELLKERLKNIEKFPSKFQQFKQQPVKRLR